MKQKLTYLNTLKFLSCIAVFNCHFLCFGYTMIGFDEVLNIRLFDSLKSGSLAVVMFVMIACMLTAMKVMQKPSIDNIKNIVIKRYFRLIVPISIVNMLIFLVYKLGLFNVAKTAGEYVGNPILSGAYQYDITVVTLITDTFIDVIRKGQAALNYPLWMVKDLFVGMFWTVLMCIVINKTKYRFVLLGMISLIALWDMGIVYVLAVLLAVLVTENNKYSDILGYISFVIGCVILVVYKDVIGIISGRMVKLSFVHTSTLYESIASFCIIYGIAKAKIINKIFSPKIFDSLNKLSFGVYLLHWPLLCAVSSRIYLWLTKYQSDKIACSITYIISLPLVMTAAYCFSILEKLLETKIKFVSEKLAGNQRE